jgi:hypothetical protein
MKLLIQRCRRTFRAPKPHLAAAARCPKLQIRQPDKSLKNYTKDGEIQM